MQRLNNLNSHFSFAYTEKKDSLSVVDNRTGTFFFLLESVFKRILGKKYELAIKDGAINATDLGKIKDENGEVTRSFDPAYMNTVSCVSNSFRITLFFRYPRYLILMATRAFSSTEDIQLSN